MSAKHPIIAITGSSGAGTTTVKDTFEKIFKREGLTVLSATDGSAGLELLRKHRVGVLLTDLMMPRTTGMDLLKAAKAAKAAELPRVFRRAVGPAVCLAQAGRPGCNALI